MVQQGQRGFICKLLTCFPSPLYCFYWLQSLTNLCHSTPGPFRHSPFSLRSLWLVSPPVCVLGMNAPMRSLTVSPATLPPIHLLPQNLSHSVTHSQSVLHICLDVRCGGHFCLYERIVDVSSVLYTILAMMLTNCCVLFTGYAWSHVMCSAGAISALLFPLVCALCLHYGCHFFLCS